MRKTAVPFVILLFVSGCADEEEPIPQEESAENWEDPVAVASVVGGLEEPAPPDPDAPAPRALRRYDRAKARQYVDWFAKTPNPRFAYCANRTRTVKADCTSFASQVLWYAGLEVRWTNGEASGWWYKNGCNARGSSKSWRQVNDLLYFLIVESGAAEYKRDPRELQVGDVIFYKLRRRENGYACDEAFTFNHTAVVSGFDSDGQPLVSYHSNDAIDVPWAANNGSQGSLGHACRALLVHIRD